METLIKKFKDFVIYYNADEEETQLETLISWMDIIVSMMGIVCTEDYMIIEKLMSFVKLVTNNDLIDDETRLDIYYRQIVPVLQDLEDRYVDRTVKPVSEVVQEFIETKFDISIVYMHNILEELQLLMKTDKTHNISTIAIMMNFIFEKFVDIRLKSGST